MAVKTKQQIIDDATALIPDNTNHEVSPADIRQRIIDVVDSSLFTEELPDFATVATTGSYNDLTNKPTYATVANTGSYNDLTNKPVYANVASTGQYVDLINRPVLATVATSGAYSDLTGKPTLGTASSANSDDFATAAQGLLDNSAVQPTRTITASTGLTGGGTLSADRTIALNANTVASLAKADSAVLYANTQTLTPAEQGQARANIGAGVLTGFRNKIINGAGYISQRQISAVNDYGPDRWRAVQGVDATHYVSTDYMDFGSLGMTAGFVWNISVAGTSPSYFGQRIEDVRTLQGKRVTGTMWINSPVATQIHMALKQVFGTGGSGDVLVSDVNIQVTAGINKYSVLFDIPSITGKVIGTNSYLEFLLYRSNAATNVVSTLHITNISLVEGDATAEDDPFSPRHIQQEEQLCFRYYEKTMCYIIGSAYAAGMFVGGEHSFLANKRTQPSVTYENVQENTNVGTVFTSRNSRSCRFHAPALAAGQAYWTCEVSFDAEL